MSFEETFQRPPRRRWRRRLTATLFAVLALAAAAATVRATLWPDEAPAPPDSVLVTRADIEETVLANGTLEAKELVSVGAQISGQIESLRVELGDHVEKGQLIAEIDPLTRRNALRDAEAVLANVRAQRRVKEATLKQAELAFQRQARMMKGSATSREAYENAEATLAVARAEIEAVDAQIAQSEISVDTAKVNLGYTRITAPMAGTVVAVPVKAGQTVNANQTTPTIVMLAELDTMTVSAEVSEADVVRVEPGQAVYFTILGEPDRRYHSRLRAVEPAPKSISSSAGTGGSSDSATDAAVYYNALFDIENPGHRLRISMTAEVSIVIAAAEQALTLPAAALGTPDAEGRYDVRVLTPDGGLEPRRIAVGINNNVVAEVLSGLAEGERVVLGPPAESAAENAWKRRGRGPLGF